MSLSDSPWHGQFTHERVHLLHALGELTEGGIVDGLQHIGATSVPGMPGSPCVDIGLAIWPFPLESRYQTAIELLGDEPISRNEGLPEQRFRHATGSFQLYIVEAGSELWTNYLLIRDFLRQNESARQIFLMHRQAHRADATNYQQIKAQLFIQTLDAARQWWVSHYGFTPVEVVARELQEYHHPWYISSGWALDLFLGHVTRVHSDVDVVVPRTDQLNLQQHLSARGWKWMTPFQGRMEPWPPHMALQLPRHQIHAHRDGAFIDFLLSDVADGIWRYRRNPAITRMPDRTSLSTSEGIPFLAPELVLLYKSQNTSGRERHQDQTDFEAAYCHLEPERRAWLRWALLATDPAHPWIERLA